MKKSRITIMNYQSRILDRFKLEYRGNNVRLLRIENRVYFYVGKKKKKKGNVSVATKINDLYS